MKRFVYVPPVFMHFKFVKINYAVLEITHRIYTRSLQIGLQSYNELIKTLNVSHINIFSSAYVMVSIYFRLRILSLKTDGCEWTFILQYDTYFIHNVHLKKLKSFKKSCIFISRYQNIL